MNVVIYFYYPSSSSETRDVLAFLGLRKSQAQNPPRSFVYLYMCHVLCAMYVYSSDNAVHCSIMISGLGKIQPVGTQNNSIESICVWM